MVENILHVVPFFDASSTMPIAAPATTEVAAEKRSVARHPLQRLVGRHDQRST
jgi:hypothetical protein